jgi:hypothetical protein
VTVEDRGGVMGLAGRWCATLPSVPQRDPLAQLRPIQAQIEATGVNTIRIGHEQLEENSREFYENRAVLRKAVHQQA